MANSIKNSALHPLDTPATSTDLVQRSVSSPIVTPPLRLTTDAVDSVAVVDPSLALKSKEMSPGQKKGRLSAISFRVRNQSKKVVEDALSQLFNYTPGTLSFCFPADATFGEGIGVWLTEGDIIRYASPGEDFKISLDESANISVIDSTVMAKFRLTAARQINNIFAIYDPIFAKKVQTVETVLTLILQNIDFAVHREVEPIKKTLTVDEAYAAFKTAATELASPVTRQMITDIINRDAVC